MALCLILYFAVFSPHSLCMCVFTLLYSKRRCSPIHLNVILDGCGMLLSKRIFLTIQLDVILLCNLFLDGFCCLSHPLPPLSCETDNQTVGEHREKEHMGEREDISSSGSSNNGSVPVFSPLLSSPGVCCSLLACSHRQTALLLWTPLSAEQPLFS